MDEAEEVVGEVEEEVVEAMMLGHAHEVEEEEVDDDDEEEEEEEEPESETNGLVPCNSFELVNVQPADAVENSTPALIIIDNTPTVTISSAASSDARPASPSPLGDLYLLVSEPTSSVTGSPTNANRPTVIVQTSPGNFFRTGTEPPQQQHTMVQTDNTGGFDDDDDDEDDDGEDEEEDEEEEEEEDIDTNNNPLEQQVQPQQPSVQAAQSAPKNEASDDTDDADDDDSQPPQNNGTVDSDRQRHPSDSSNVSAYSTAATIASTISNGTAFSQPRATSTADGASTSNSGNIQAAEESIDQDGVVPNEV